MGLRGNASQRYFNWTGRISLNNTKNCFILLNVLPLRTNTASSPRSIALAATLDWMLTVLFLVMPICGAQTVQTVRLKR